MGIETIDIKNNKGAQAIRIPKKMKINDDKVYLKKVGNTLYIIPYHSPWQNLIESTDSFTADFMGDRNQPVQQQKLDKIEQQPGSIYYSASCQR